MFFTRAVSLLIAVWALSSLVATAAEAGGPQEDVIAERSKQLGTNIPQNQDARAVLVASPEAKLTFPGFLIGLEKAPIVSVGCPANRGLSVEGGDPEVRNHLNKTLNYVYIDNGKESLQIEDPLCLFVSHTAEFAREDDSSEYKPKISYSAYRDDQLPTTRDAYERGRQALLALRARLRAVATERAAKGEAITHFIVFATGWHTVQVQTLKAMDQLHATIKAAAQQEGTNFNPLMIGISWPSFSPEIAENAGKRIGKVVDRQKSVIPDFVPRRFMDNLSQTEDFLEMVLKNEGIAAAFGRLGYPALSKDADEIGIVWASALVNQVLMPLREEIATKPAVVVIGHSFGARIATWSAFSGPLLPPVEGVAIDNGNGNGNGPDVIIGLQGAFPAGRFDKKAASVHDRRPYHEGAPFASFQEKRTHFAYTGSSHDFAVKVARPFDITIGDNLAFKDKKRFTDDLFDRRKVQRDRAGTLQMVSDDPPAPRKVLLVDASSIITRHTDILNLEAGWLIWKIIQSTKRRRAD
jgi:hypothetical protein